jgi:hypothetical protein
VDLSKQKLIFPTSWSALRESASSSSDEDLARSIQGTALYATLLACATKEIDQSLLLRPAQAFFSGSTEEEDAVRARFSSSYIYDGVPIEQVVEEYGRESEGLKEWIEDKQIRLEQFYDEVERLVNLELQKGESGNDTAMFDDSMAQ